MGLYEDKENEMNGNVLKISDERKSQSWNRWKQSGIACLQLQKIIFVIYENQLLEFNIGSYVKWRSNIVPASIKKIWRIMKMILCLIPSDMWWCHQENIHWPKL